MVREIANNKGSRQTAKMHRLVSQATKSGFLGLCMRAANVQASLCDCVACLSDSYQVLVCCLSTHYYNHTDKTT